MIKSTAFNKQLVYHKDIINDKNSYREVYSPTVYDNRQLM